MLFFLSVGPEAILLATTASARVQGFRRRWPATAVQAMHEGKRRARADRAE
jgi:hypothetical protein